LIKFGRKISSTLYEALTKFLVTVMYADEQYKRDVSIAFL